MEEEDQNKDHRTSMFAVGELDNICHRALTNAASGSRSALHKHALLSLSVDAALLARLEER